MKIQWSGSIEVRQHRDEIYNYLADFSRHREWVGSLESFEIVEPGDASGVGQRFIALERVDFSGSDGFFAQWAKRTSGRTESEVRELVPGQRIVWYAHPIPNVGGALLSFDLTDGTDGGTVITQMIEERYPFPIAILMRVMTNFSETGAKVQFDRGLQRLKEVLDEKFATDHR